VLRSVMIASAFRLSTMVGFARSGRLGLWELDRTETDAEGCIFVQLLQELSS